MKSLSQYGDVIPIKACFEEYLDLENKIKDDIDVFYHFAFEGGFGGNSLKDYDLQLKNTKYTCDAVKLASILHAKKFVFSSSVNAVSYTHLDVYKRQVDAFAIEPDGHPVKLRFVFHRHRPPFSACPAVPPNRQSGHPCSAFPRFSPAVPVRRQ